MTVLVWVFALLACTAPEPEAVELTFVRGGVLASSGEHGRQVAGGRRFFAQAWTAGAPVTVAGVTHSAPRRPECVTLFDVALGDVSRLVASGGDAPNTAMAWSPDGRTLAIGSYLGEVLLVDGWSGDVRVRRQLAETMVKSVLWSADGSTLYAAEQSPEALLRALDPVDLSDRWTLRLADRVGTSVMPGEHDVYGVYSLPAAYGLELLPNGDLLTTAMHAWTEESGERRNQAQVLRVSASGAVVDQWPETPVSATIKHPRVDVEAGLVALSVARSASGPAPGELPIGGALVLSLDTLEPTLAVAPEPLGPWFATSYVWDALDISEHGVFLGFGDGRSWLVDLDGTRRVERSSGAPVMAGEVPIHASVGYGRFVGEGVVMSTSGTLIPWGAVSSELRPPMAHPGANTVWSLDLAGGVRWTWSGSQELTGLSLSDDESVLVAGAGPRQTDARRDLYGAMLFDLSDPDDGRSGEDRFEVFCATEGPVFFRQALSADGRLALSEFPYVDEQGTQRGAYRVTVLR